MEILEWIKHNKISTPKYLAKVNSQIAHLYVECLWLPKARLYCEAALEAAKNDEYLSIKFKLMAKARVLKKTGFFVESLEELKEIENILIERIDKSVAQS